MNLFRTARFKSSGHMTDILFTLALFCVFAASALLVVLIGANVYQSTVTEMNASFDSTTSVSWLATRVRQHDEAGQVESLTFDGSAGQFSGVNALVLYQQLESGEYCTVIYYHDGALRELFTEYALLSDLSPDSGQAILSASAFSAAQDQNGLLRLSVTDPDGETSELLLALRSDR